jgi:hypothetical protein
MIFRRPYICTTYLCSYRTSEIFKVKNSHKLSMEKLKGEDQSKRSSNKDRLVRRDEDVRLDSVLIFNDDPFTVWSLPVSFSIIDMPTCTPLHEGGVSGRPHCRGGRGSWSRGCGQTPGSCCSPGTGAQCYWQIYISTNRNYSCYCLSQ